MTVLSALNTYYDRLAARDEVPPFGYSYENISFAIILSQKGKLLDVQDIRVTSDGKPRPRRLAVPQSFKRPGTTPRSFFLWDESAYVLGVSSRQPERALEKHQAFLELHRSALHDIDDTGARSLLRFFDGWSPSDFGKSPFSENMADTRFVFRMDGEQCFIHDHPPLQEAWHEILSLGVGATKEAPQTGLCLVTGKESVTARIHPPIRGIIKDGQAADSIVSFNHDAFISYGKKQGANAPISERAAFAYTTALNKLLRRDSSNKVQVGDATTVFWAEASPGREDSARAAEELFALLINPPAPGDAQETAKVRDVLEKIEKGRPLEEAKPHTAEATRFYVLGLSPNAARLSVRFWYEGSLGDLARRFRDHWDALRIEPTPWRTAPSIWRLLVKTTALQEKFDNIPPQLAGEVMRSVLTGLPYPRTLLAAAVMRLRAGDKPGSGWHAAVIKACINRSLDFHLPKTGDSGRNLPIDRRRQEEELPVALEPNKKDAAYQLGRLFAVLEAAQYAALGRVNAPIGDRYYAAASATPARVFGPLLRGLKHHVSDAKKRGKGGWIEPKVGEIMLLLPPDLPKTLRLEDQGRFAVGYYHERATRVAKDDDTETEGEDNGK